MATGYGSDVSLTDRLVAGRLVTQRQVVAEALYRRLITPRGTLPEDLTYGFDVSAFIGAVGHARAIAAISGMVTNELSKDDRVSGVTCQVFVDVLPDGTKALKLGVAATLVDTDEDFSLTVQATDLAANLLVIT